MDNKKGKDKILIELRADTDEVLNSLEYVKQTINKPMIENNEKENFYLFILYTKTKLMDLFKKYSDDFLKNNLKEYNTLLFYYNALSNSIKALDTLGICFPDDLYKDFVNFRKLNTEDVYVNRFSEIMRETSNEYYRLQIKYHVLDIEVTRSQFLQSYYKFLEKLSKIPNQEQVGINYIKSLRPYEMESSANWILKYIEKYDNLRNIEREKIQKILKTIGKIAFVCFVIFSILIILFLSSYYE